jgi:hypothetical protein
MDMSTFYEVWDDRSGNRLGEYETLADARALLRSIFDSSGPDAVRSLAVLAYIPTASGEYDVTTIVEGSDFVASLGPTTMATPASIRPDKADKRRDQRTDRSA